MELIFVFSHQAVFNTITLEKYSAEFSSLEFVFARNLSLLLQKKGLPFLYKKSPLSLYLSLYIAFFHDFLDNIFCTCGRLVQLFICHN